MELEQSALWDFLAQALSAINHIDSDLKLLAFALVLLVFMVLVLALMFRTQTKLIKWILSFAFGIFTMVFLLGLTAKSFAFYWQVENQSIQEQLGELEGGAQALAPLEADSLSLGEIPTIVIPERLSRHLASLVERIDFYGDIGIRRVSAPAIVSGRLAFLQKENQEAERLLSKAQFLEPSKEALNDLGVVSYSEGRIEEAAGYFRSALEIDSQFPNPMNGLGLIAYTAGSEIEVDPVERHDKLEEAIMWFDRALEIDSNYGRVLNNRGLVYRELGRIAKEPSKKLGYFKKAEAGFREAARVLPESPEVRLNLGLISKNMGDEEQAITHYRAALELKPDYSQVLNNLAMILSSSEEHSDPAEAVVLAKRATELNPEDPGYLDTLARSYLSAGRKQEAQEAGSLALEQAVRQNKPYVDQIKMFLEQVPGEGGGAG